VKINWRSKIASRKFWALVAALVTANLVLFGVNEETIVKVTAVLTQFGAVVTYILVEGSIDKSHKHGDKSGGSE